MELRAPGHRRSASSSASASALIAASLLPRDAARDGIPAHQRSLYALGVAFADLRRDRAAAARQRPDRRVRLPPSCSASAGPTSARDFEARAEDIVEIVKLGVFVVFGSLLTFGGLFGDGWAAVGDRRRHAAGRAAGRDRVALGGDARLHRATKAFMAWFGPKGVATMTFSLLVLAEPIADGERIFNIAALVRLLLDPRPRADRHAGREWIARSATREAQPAPAPSGTPPTGG